jgi:glucokinase
MNVIAADVGGTKTRLVFADTEAPQRILHEARYECADFDGFDSLLHAFLRDNDLQGEAVGMLSLALPGVVEEQRARLTNLPWTLDKQELRKEFGVQDVHFMNDFQASAMGIPHLRADDMIALNQGDTHQHETRVVVGAGTGLGVAWLQGDGADTRAYSTEGGHIDFAPVDEVQIELLGYLLESYEHVSYERLLSGQGLQNLYRFTSGEHGSDIEPHQISAKAEQGNEDAQRALQLFVRIYGAYIANLALMFKPRGGVYITGGIGAKIQQWMLSADFISAYFNKGRMRSLVERTAVYLVTNERVGVIGAMAEAVKMQQVKSDEK